MTCDRCENQAAYTRKYSGEKLCSECFSKSIVKKTAKTISKYKMIKHNELVAVAVSGGKDSLALLKVIHDMSLTHNFRIKVITIDFEKHCEHNFSPEYFLVYAGGFSHLSHFMKLIIIFH